MNYADGPTGFLDIPMKVENIINALGLTIFPESKGVKVFKMILSKILWI